MTGEVFAEWTAGVHGQHHEKLDERRACKVGTVRNSCSTMHTITNKEFELDDFSHEHLDTWGTNWLEQIIDVLNVGLGSYLHSRDKDEWWQIIQLAFPNADILEP